MSRKKVSLIGAGNIGGVQAQLICQQQLADVVLFDPSIKHTLGAESQHCLSDFTMFEGKEVLGKPVVSMQRGEIIIEDGELKRPVGKARFYEGNGSLAAWSPKGHTIG